MEKVPCDAHPAPPLPHADLAAVPPSTRPRHIPELDGIRGLAILLVLLSHFTENLHTANPRVTALLKIPQAGWCGVDLFFVLSGFLITGILWDSKGSRHFFRNFYARRILRIFPLYYGSLFFLLVLLPAVAPSLAAIPILGDMTAELSAKMSRAREYGTQYLWLHAANVLSAWKEWVFPEHFWSLAVEEHFYLFWPVVVFRFRRLPLMLISLGIVAAAFAFRIGLIAHSAHVSVYVLTPCRMDALAIGSMLALAVRNPGGISALVGTARAVFAGAGAAWLFLAIRSRSWFQFSPSTQTVGYTLVAAFFGAMIILATGSGQESRLGRFFRLPILRFFGKYSYGLYILHLFPAVLLGPYFALNDSLGPSRIARSLLGTMAAGTNGGASVAARILDAALYIGTGVALTVVLAWLSWHLFESRFLALKRFFEEDRLDRVPGPRAARRSRAPHFAWLNGLGESLSHQGKRRSSSDVARG